MHIIIFLLSPAHSYYEYYDTVSSRYMTAAHISNIDIISTAHAWNNSLTSSVLQLTTHLVWMGRRRNYCYYDPSCTVRALASGLPGDLLISDYWLLIEEWAQGTKYKCRYHSKMRTTAVYSACVMEILFQNTGGNNIIGVLIQWIARVDLTCCTHCHSHQIIIHLCDCLSISATTVSLSLQPSLFLCSPSRSPCLSLSLYVSHHLYAIV